MREVCFKLGGEIHARQLDIFSYLIGLVRIDPKLMIPRIDRVIQAFIDRQAKNAVFIEQFTGLAYEAPFVCKVHQCKG